MKIKDPKPSFTYQTTKQPAAKFLREMMYMALFKPENEPEFPLSILENPEIRKYIENFGSRHLDMAVIAYRDRYAVGIIWGRKFSAIHPSYGFISDAIPEVSMAVKRAYRNLGIGSVLLEKISEYYRGKKVKAISLSVDMRSPAMDLYKREGFEFFSEKGGSLTMVKHL